MKPIFADASYAVPDGMLVAIMLVSVGSYIRGIFTPKADPRTALGPASLAVVARLLFGSLNAPPAVLAGVMTVLGGLLIYELRGGRKHLPRRRKLGDPNPWTERDVREIWSRRGRQSSARSLSYQPSQARQKKSK